MKEKKKWVAGLIILLLLLLLCFFVYKVIDGKPKVIEVKFIDGFNNEVLSTQEI